MWKTFCSHYQEYRDLALLEKVTAAFLFLGIFTLPQDSLPRIPIFSYGELRWGQLFLIITTAIFIFSKRISIENLRLKRYFIPTVLFFIFNIIFLKSPIKGFMFLGWFVLNWFIYSLVDSTELLSKWIWRSYISCAIFSALHIIISTFFYPHFFAPDSIELFRLGTQLRPFAYLGEPSYASLLLVPAYFLALKKEISPLFLVILILGCVLCYARTAYVGLIVVTFLVLFGSSRKLIKRHLILLFVALLTSLIVYPNFWGIKKSLSIPLSTQIQTEQAVASLPPHINPSMTGGGSPQHRFISLERGLILLKENLLWGVGLGASLLRLQERFQNENAVEGLHNLYLEIAVETGLIGLILTLLIFFQIGRKKTRPQKEALACIFFLLMFAQNINMPALWILLFMPASAFQNS